MYTLTAEYQSFCLFVCLFLFKVILIKLTTAAWVSNKRKCGIYKGTFGKKHPHVSTGSATRQPSVSSLFGNPRQCDMNRAEKITELIMTVRDTLPLCFVESKGFKKLLKFVELEYKCPGRHAITTRVEIRHQKMTVEIKLNLEKAEFVGITTDGWTAMTTESYMTITCHAMIDGELCNYVLQTTALEERHTAENLAAFLRDAISKWRLEKKVITRVHDNATNMAVANKDLLE